MQPLRTREAHSRQRKQCPEAGRNWTGLSNWKKRPLYLSIKKKSELNLER